MIAIFTAACGGFLAGWVCRARQLPMGPPNGSYGGRFDPDWQRSFNHENINHPSGPPPLKWRRSGDAGSLRPTTPKPDIIPKPQFPAPRVIPGDTP